MATTFYKPDPNNPTLYNTQNQPVSYNEYKTQGGLGIEGGGGWTDVISGPVPTQAAITTYNPTTGTGGLQMPSIVTSTTGTQNNIKNLDTGITNAQNQSVGLADLLKLFQPQDTSAQDAASTKFLADRQAQLDKRQADEIARLTAEYSTEKARTETQQATDLAPIDRRLQLLRDTTVGPNAQLEEQLTLQRDKMLQANKLELERLYNTRENFIAQARTSFDDQDFKLAESQMKQAKDAQQQIYERSKDAMNMALNFAQEQRLSTQQSYNQQKDVRDFLVENGINSQFYMFPGSSAVYSSQNPGVVLTSDQYKQMGGVGETGGWKDVQVVKPEWSDPYLMGGDYIQRNNKTGEIRTAVNVTGGGTGGLATQNAAVNLFSGIVDQALAEGASPADAVLAAVATADATGTKLGLKEQNALLTYANTKKAIKEQPKKEVKTETPVAPAAPTGSAFSQASVLGTRSGNYFTNIPSATWGGIKDLGSGISNFFKTW